GPVPSVNPQILSAEGSLFLTRPTMAHYILTRQALLDRASEVLNWVASGELSVRVGARYSLAEAGSAHTALQSRQTTGKVLLLP
ncbi:MAG: zinc-binding dehydrogenase, partial [Candidatus Latescibacteria bacterium]|nr:zinc-binding dehydrogenase [Candidatus Latescibacterota bacterium]